MTVNNVYIHFRNNIERLRKHSITNTDVSGNNRLVLSLEKSYLPLHWSRVGQPARSLLGVRRASTLHTVNNCACMSVHFYNIMPTFVN